MLAAVLIALAVPLQSHAQATYSTGFEPPTFTLGDVSGQDGWGHISNSPTGGFVEAAPAGSPAQFQAQSLAIRTIHADFFGVANHLYSATIPSPAGENGSTVDGVVVPDPQSLFSATLWFRTPDVPVVVPNRADGRFAELNPSSKGPDADDPANRYAQVRLFNDAGGKVRVEMFWYTASGSSIATVGYIDWGAWYRFEYRIELVDGLAGSGDPNDRFRLSIFDINGNEVGSACGSTWEVGWKSGTFGGGSTARALNGFDFWSTAAPNGTTAGWLDNISFSSSTPLGGALAVTIGGATNVCAGGTTTLTANPTGGSGEYTTYTWRDAQNAIVGTNATYDAGAGAYTVTVTDSVCATATSSSFVVNSYAPLGVTIQNNANTLSANVTGGSGNITSYAWRDAQNNVVATTPTYAAGPGTYTVTVTDAECGPATSAPVTIAAPAVATPIPTLSEGVLIALMVMLGAAAVMRMR